MIHQNSQQVKKWHEISGNKKFWFYLNSSEVNAKGCFFGNPSNSKTSGKMKWKIMNKPIYLILSIKLNDFEFFYHQMEKVGSSHPINRVFRKVGRSASHWFQFFGWVNGPLDYFRFSQNRLFILKLLFDLAKIFFYNRKRWEEQSALIVIAFVRKERE